MPICALIIDDSSVMRKIVERSLRQAGINLTQVFEAGNGAEALAVLQVNRVDLILCDVNMPVMDGLEFIKQLPAVPNAKDVPVVMRAASIMWCKLCPRVRRGTSGSHSRPNK
jgi:two-component system, chemotaxis family, chemotaxis protein CheY